MMEFTLPIIFLVAIFGILTIVIIVRLASKRRFLLDSYLGYSWLFFLGFAVFELISRPAGIAVLALISFRAIREYFSLVDIRLQDRLAVLGAYLSIPFLYYFVQSEWYGMFIISVPVYAFLAIPILVTLGGKKTEGTVLSIGIIDYGLFLFVFCIGHIGYLLLYSSWMAALLIINVFVCDLVICLVRRRTKSLLKRLIYSFVFSAPFTLMISMLLSRWTEIPLGHSAILASMTPILVIMGHHVGDYVEKDLGIEEDLLVPGRGQILDNLQSLFYVAPVMFHYIRYFLK